MWDPTPDVREVIDGFAERLLALTDGKQIPNEWMLYLAKRLAPEPKPPGRPPALACLEAVAYATASRYFEKNPIAAKNSPNEDKKKARLILPGQCKQRIAEECGVSVRTITSMQRIIDEYLPKDPVPCASQEDPEPPPPDEKRDAVMKGIAHAIADSSKRRGGMATP